jgi:phage tail-like protein
MAKSVSSYQQYLPVPLQGDPVVGQFLQAFEKVLTGSGAAPASFRPQILREYDLLLVPASSGKPFPPESGTRLVAIGQNDDQTLRLCIFDQQSDKAVDLQESNLTAKSAQVATLKALIQPYWFSTPTSIVADTKQQIRKTVAAIADYPLSGFQNVGLEEVIRHVDRYFNPAQGQAPAEFLPWLAGWVALSLREDWEDATKRQFIRQIVPLYKLRGTKPGLEQILGLYLKSLTFPRSVTIYDQFEQYPNYFQVQITLPYPDPSKYWQQARIAKAIIDQEKPAHTYYALRILTPTMRLTGRMVTFHFGSGVEPQVKTFEIEVLKASNPVPLIVGLNARSFLEINTQPQIQELAEKASVRYSVRSEYRPDTADWQVTLSRDDHPPEVTLRLQNPEEPLYLSLNNLTQDRVKVQVTPRDGNAGSLTLDLDPALRLYQRNKTKLATGNTVIGTQTGPP